MQSKLPKLIQEIADQYHLTDEQELANKVAELYTQKPTDEDLAWASRVIEVLQREQKI
jgi:hypothetical protein